MVSKLMKENVHLTGRENGILNYLMNNPDTIHTPEEIYENVWCEKPYRCRGIISVHICHLREKMSEQNFSLDCFRGQGYRYNSVKVS